MLKELEINLAKSLNPDLHSSADWGDLKSMSRVLAAVRRQHDSPLERADDSSISNAVLQYQKNGQLQTFREIKYVCLGVTQIDGGSCLLSNDRLLGNLLTLAESGEPRRQMKLFQCLLSSYWHFPRPDDGKVPSSIYSGWHALRSWLAKQQKALDVLTIYKSDWFTIIGQHANLLTETPCDRYGPSMLNGDEVELRQVVKNLAIPLESWFMEAIIFAQIRSASALSDEDFRGFLPRLIKISKGDTEIDISKDLSRRCTAQLVSRYSQCNRKTENTALCDLAVKVIGNPWLRRDAWDAYVRKENRNPDEAAREMINSWLKRRLIKNFFELLSEDQLADPRRLQYWLRFESHIEDMWFALGSHACKNQGKGFVDFRQSANGRLLELDGATAENNAFIMRMGEYLAVEFGKKGHAFFLLRWSSLPKRLTQKLNGESETSHIGTSELKPLDSKKRLLHKDLTGRGLSWEQEFDVQICPLVGRPIEEPFGLGRRSKRVVHVRRQSNISFDTRLTQSNLEIFKDMHSLQVVDDRQKGGALWVVAGNLSPAINNPLEKWGFQYKAGKGWWKE